MADLSQVMASSMAAISVKSLQQPMWSLWVWVRRRKQGLSVSSSTTPSMRPIPEPPSMRAALSPPMTRYITGSSNMPPS